MGVYGMLEQGGTVASLSVAAGEGRLVQDQAARRCSVCDCVLSRYNTADRCGACGRSPHLPPADELWSTAAARNALSSWDVGPVIALYRRHTGAKQSRIATAVGIDQSEVSRLERGLKQLRDRQQVLAWTRVLGVPETLIPAHPIVAPPDPAPAPVASGSSTLVDSGSQLTDLILALADSDAAVEAAIQMWRADSVGHARSLSDADLAGEVLAWLTSRPRPVTGRTGSRRIGMADVLRVRTALDAFASLDNAHGGGRARDSAVRFLVDRVAPMLNGSFSEKTGKALYAAAWEFTLLVAWMAYDIGDEARARAGFAHALALAEAANDRSLGASVLSAIGTAPT